MEFHEKLQELRKQKGFTQETLAEALHVSRTAVSKWESGRGYPNIDSLKALAKLLGVTIDNLLSGDELLSVAEAEHKQQTHLRDLVFGLLDLCAGMFFFLPFFRQTAAGRIQSVSLLTLTEVAPHMRAAYFVSVGAMVILGVLTLALQNYRRTFWLRSKHGLSLACNIAVVLLCILGLQPYAACFLFVLLLIKALVLIKRP